VYDIANKVASTAKASENIRAGVGEVSSSAERIAKGAEVLSSLAGDMEGTLALVKL
jgi:methyl-accepting chemotaxis protein